MYLVDSFYNLKDSEFIDKIKEDLNKYLINLKINRVLLVPKFDYHHRYLIHQIVQSLFHDLFSFSLGDKENRRLFICSKQLTIKSNALLKDTNKMSTNEILVESNNKIKDKDIDKKSKRPSQHFYVPKGRRSNNKKEVVNSNSTNNTQQTDVDSLTNTLDELNIKKDEKVVIETSETENVIKEVVDSWDNLYDDSGECTNKNLIKELNSVVEDNVELEVEQLSPEDYDKWVLKNVELDDNEFSHVIEIYDFPVEFKNEHIYNTFKDTLRHSNFDIKWVDDTHCLGIFATTQAANEALRLNNPFLKTRSIVYATDESKSKAQKCVKSLKPYKARPETTSFVASKLIGASLGLGNLLSSTSKAVEEKKKLQNARDKRRKEKEIQEAIWNGNV